MIQIVDNFYLSNLITKNNALEELVEKKKEDNRKYYIDDYIKYKNGYYALSYKKDNNDKKIIGEINLTLKDYKDEKSPNNIFFSFFKDEEKKASKNQEKYHLQNLAFALKKYLEISILYQSPNHSKQTFLHNFQFEQDTFL
jgi:hypothetical protein